MSRRANSANPRRALIRDLDDGIAQCAAQYQARGLPAIFRVPSFVHPSLDAKLEALGYGVEGETTTLYGHGDAVVAEPDPDVDIRPVPGPDWLAAMTTLQGYSAAQGETYRRMVAAIAVPAAFAALRVDGELVALAFGAVDGDIHCCESVVTAAAYRRRGYGQRTVAAVHRWALDRGAKHFCIQVESTNLPAVNLYQGLGLRGELYLYHYRREPLA